jgi:hypothetical protein
MRVLFIPGIISFFSFLLCVNINIHGQKVSGKLKFDQGKTLVIQMEIKTTVAQQVMENAIPFSADGSAIHSYKVTSTTTNNTTLHHEAKKIVFNFEGMGQKRSFDSDNEKDMAEQFGEPVKNILNKKFDVIIDANGKVVTIRPEKMEPVKADERLAIVLNMLKDITDIAYPPQKGEASFFKVLPANETAKGESWTDSIQNETGKFKTIYTLSAIMDSTIVIDFKGNATTVSKVMMMGRETTTTMNSSSTGKIILDGVTRIVKEKTITTESNGHTEAMGGTMPVTAKTTIIIHVKQE